MPQALYKATMLVSVLVVSQPHIMAAFTSKDVLNIFFQPFQKGVGSHYKIGDPALSSMTRTIQTRSQ
jgi:hypothetical protein